MTGADREQQQERRNGGAGGAPGGMPSDPRCRRDVTYQSAFVVNVLLGAAVVGLLVALLVVLTADKGLPSSRRRWLLRSFGGLAGVLVATKAANAVSMGNSSGWVFAEPTLRWDVPLLGLPVLAVLLSVWLPDPVGRPAIRVGLAVWATGTAAGVFVEQFFLRRPALLLPVAVLAAAAGGLAWHRASGRAAAGRRWRARWTAPVGLAAVVALGTTSWADSRLPGRYDLGALASMDTGGAGGAHGATHDINAPGSVSVATLTGPQDRHPDVSYTLVAQRTTATTPGAPGRAGLSFNGQVPGPALRAREGDLIEVVLRNQDIPSGVSVHWHGYDVPNAEDGVAGVTQEAVRVGGTHTYRFLAEQVGTFWYHSHQASSTQVARGLYGSLVVMPRAPDTVTTDLVVIDHGWRGTGGFLEGDKQYDETARVERRVLAPGTPVRLRLINSRNSPQRYRLVGTGFRVTAIDGGDLNAPQPLREQAVLLAAGGRYDLAFVMPAGPVQLLGLGGGVNLALSDGFPPGAVRSQAWPVLDPARYGEPLQQEKVRYDGPYDRDFTMDIDRRVGLVDGRPGYFWSVNGFIYPRMPMYMVAEGDLVRVTLVNRTLAHHPIHLHGHHMQVLERNGRRLSGSPWSSDTLNMAPGERYVIAFRADNPGIWMDHCHDLQHAAQGFVMHVGYEGVSTPYRIGRDSGNQPE